MVVNFQNLKSFFINIIDFGLAMSFSHGPITCEFISSISKKLCIYLQRFILQSDISFLNTKNQHFSANMISNEQKTFQFNPKTHPAHSKHQKLHNFHSQNSTNHKIILIEIEIHKKKNNILTTRATTRRTNKISFLERDLSNLKLNI